MISLHQVSKAYKADSIALQDVDLEIERGEFVSLVGKSGSGKTTLIKLLIAEEPMTSGELAVELDGKRWRLDLLNKRQKQLYRRKIGIIFQDFKLLQKKTAYENIAFAMQVSGRGRREIIQDVPRMLDLVGLSHKADSFPPELSGGEQQRVAIARAMINKPELLVADEPTGDLDSITSWEIAELLLKINSLGTTVIFASHAKELVNSIKKRVITLDGGRLVRSQKQGRYML